jgi:hypothetical protein
MPNETQVANLEIEEIEEDDDFCKDDYGFVLGPSGELKSIMFPENLMSSPPEAVTKILSLFGIDGLHELENRVLH